MYDNFYDFILACNLIASILNVMCQIPDNLIQCELKLIWSLLCISLKIKHDLIYKTGVKPIFTSVEHESLKEMVNCDYEIIWSLPVFSASLHYQHIKVLIEQRRGRGQPWCILEIRSAFSRLFHVDLCNSDFLCEVLPVCLGIICLWPRAIKRYHIATVHWKDMRNH